MCAQKWLKESNCIVSYSDIFYDFTIKILQSILNLISKNIYMIQKSFSFVHRQNVMHVLRIGHVDSYLQSIVMKHFSLKLGFINDVLLPEKQKGEKSNREVFKENF